MIILLHSSKTMRHSRTGESRLRPPLFLEQARELDAYLKTLSPAQLAKAMNLSPGLAEKTRDLIAAWSGAPELQSLAVDSFTGDIYSGLHANDLSLEDRDYADQVLRILSGLYGILRPYDGICPYRLEMGYRLPGAEFSSLYAYWGDKIASSLPAEGLIVNLAADEYSRVVTRHVVPERVVSPKFLTTSPKTGRSEFVVVHAKIARGAFARWLITRRARDAADLEQFDDLGYCFDDNLSANNQPVFVCETFGGKGLSIRLG